MGHQPKIIFELSYRTMWLSSKLFLCQIRNYRIGQPCQKKIQVWTCFFCCPVGQNLFVMTVTPHLQGILHDQKNFITFLKPLICAACMCYALVVCISHSLRLGPGAWYYFHSGPRPPNLNFSHKRKVCLCNHVELAEPPTCAPQKALLTLLW